MRSNCLANPLCCTINTVNDLIDDVAFLDAGRDV
jgi:hypothetical protein